MSYRQITKDKWRSIHFYCLRKLTCLERIARKKVLQLSLKQLFFFVVAFHPRRVFHRKKWPSCPLDEVLNKLDTSSCSSISALILYLFQCPLKEKETRDQPVSKTQLKCKILRQRDCEPLHGYFAQRGLPVSVPTQSQTAQCGQDFGLLLGKILERATPRQYYNDFDCKKIGFIQRLPQQWYVKLARHIVWIIGFKHPQDMAL